MSFSEAKKRAEKLRKEIEKIRYDYHVLNKETVSEAVKTSLMHELAQIEERFPELVVPESPTQRVAGKPLPGFKKVIHKYPGLSLNDVFDLSELEAWENRIQKLYNFNQTEIGSENWEFFAELKIDGLSVYLTYEKGKLRTAATRGDGRVGEDVTVNIKTIEAIPLELTEPVNVEVRGEVFMSFQEFERVNREQVQKGLPVYANPRNLAAGTLRQLDPKIVASRKLDFAAWALYSDRVKTHEEQHLYAQKLGFRIESHVKLCRNLKEVLEFVNFWEQNRKKLPYQTDGVVITVNSNKIFEALGYVGRAPRGAVAWKYSAEQATTKILDIKVSVGRTGALTPYAVMEPVKLAGTTVTRATLHNEDEIKRKDIRIGDTVIVQKAGDIIPEVVQSLPNLRNGKEKKFFMPKRCPVCGGIVIKPLGEAVSRCSAKNCIAIEKEKVKHFVSREAFNIEGLGEKIIEQLFEVGLISDAADIFALKREDIESLERFAEKSAENLINAINSRKVITLNRFIFALGIRHIGAVAANDIANYFGSIEGIRNAAQEELEKIPGIGPVAAQSVFEWFKEEKNLIFLEKLFKYGVRIENTPKNNQKLAGQTFVITGSLESMTREEAEQRIRSMGGRVSSGVSKNTNYLIVGLNPGSKLKKSQLLGIKILDEKQFLSLLR